jgi:hypothetical protein
MEEAARQTAIDPREHHSSVGIKFLRKLPTTTKEKASNVPWHVAGYGAAAQLAGAIEP